MTKHGMAAVVPQYDSDMPAFAALLSDEEIDAILDYLESTWPEQARRYHEDQSRRR